MLPSRGGASPFLFVSIASSLLALTAGCTRPSSESPATTGAANPPTPSVTLLKPMRRTLHRTVDQPGTIEAFQQTPMFAKIAGYVDKVRVDIGDRVRKDDILAELSVPEMVQELKRKQALVRQAQTSV